MLSLLSFDTVVLFLSAISESVSPFLMVTLLDLVRLVLFLRDELFLLEELLLELLTFEELSTSTSERLVNRVSAW